MFSFWFQTRSGSENFDRNRKDSKKIEKFRKISTLAYFPISTVVLGPLSSLGRPPPAPHRVLRERDYFNLAHLELRPPPPPDPRPPPDPTFRCLNLGPMQRKRRKRRLAPAPQRRNRRCFRSAVDRQQKPGRRSVF